MNPRLRQLYQQVILRHSKSPFHFEKRESAPLQVEAYNPFCGDQFRWFLEVEKGKVVGIAFHGQGCAISKAASSVLAEALQGQTVEESMRLIRQFLETTEEGELAEGAPEAFEAFAAAREFPERMDCATLSAHCLRQTLGA